MAVKQGEKCNAQVVGQILGGLERTELSSSGNLELGWVETGGGVDAAEAELTGE